LCMSFTFGTVAAGPRAGCERLRKNCDVTPRNRLFVTLFDQRLRWSKTSPEVITTQAFDRAPSIIVASTPVFC
jgi:hypothetical protein